MNHALLELDDCTVRFGGLTALSRVTFAVKAGELTGLIGPNGAGKTTVFNLITGVYQPTAGTVCFDQQICNGHRPYRITARGIARTFQNIRLFGSLSVLENVRTAFNLNLQHGAIHALTRGPAFQKQEAEVLEESRRLLEIFGLLPLAGAPCLSLSYGDQRRLEIARALATRPKLLLLDEPAAGMNASEKRTLMELIRFTQKEFGVTVLLVEHDMHVVMGVCRRILVMDQGCLIADGAPEEIRKHPDVIRAYLGKSE